MLRVRDIYPQAASGSLADVVGSCVGSHRPASGCLVCFCCLGSLAGPVLLDTISLDSLGFCEALFCTNPFCNLWMNSLRPKLEPFFTAVFNAHLNCHVKYSGKPKPNQNFSTPQNCVIFISLFLPVQCVYTQLLDVGQVFCRNTMFSYFCCSRCDFFKASFVPPIVIVMNSVSDFISDYK